MPLGSDTRRPPTKVGVPGSQLQRPSRPAHFPPGAALEHQDIETNRALKAAIRAEKIAARRALSQEEAIDAAEAAARFAFPALEPQAGKTIALYMPIQGEMPPGPLALLLREAGARLALPRVVDPRFPMQFREWLPGDTLEKGFGNIREPSLDAPILVPDAVIVPLSAFDRHGFRIGYGQGHYDRTLGELARNRRPFTIGYAFALQEVRRAPRDLHDVPLDMVVTEAEAIRCTGPLAGT